MYLISTIFVRYKSINSFTDIHIIIPFHCHYHGLMGRLDNFNVISATKTYYSSHNLKKITNFTINSNFGKT